MDLALIYDTETTGLPIWEHPSDDPRQPHIVQLGALLVDLRGRKIVHEFEAIVRPDGWEIPPETTDVHGITMERAMDEGRPEAEVLDQLMDMWDGRLRIAHNESFDARIVRIAVKRHHDNRGAEWLTPPSDVWKAGKAECTQRLSSPILKLPPTERMIAAGRRHAKAPNLAEAYKHFTGRDLDGAHNALVDVHACMHVYFGCLDHAGKVAA